MKTAKELKSQYGVSSKELADLEASAQTYEKGEWPSGKISRVGRPSIATDEAKPITVRLSISQIAALDQNARQTGGTRSSAVRKALSEWLIKT